MRVQPDTHGTLVPADWLWPQNLDSVFPRRQPLELDLGCGKGRFLLARARANPDRNFLGVERQLVRVRRIDRKIGREALDNVRLFRVEAAYAVRFLLPRRAFETVYIMHPDPWPKARHAHHRIMGPTFLDALAEILAPGGRVHFSTDHLPYFHRVVELLAGRSDFEEIAPFRPGEEERSDFERLFLDRRPIGRYSIRTRTRS